MYIGVGAIAYLNSWNNEYDLLTFLTGLNCNGSEQHLLNCPIDINAPACPTNGDANVICPGIC